MGASAIDFFAGEAHHHDASVGQTLLLDNVNGFLDFGIAGPIVGGDVGLVIFAVNVAVLFHHQFDGVVGSQSGRLGGHTVHMKEETQGRRIGRSVSTGRDINDDVAGIAVRARPGVVHGNGGAGKMHGLELIDDGVGHHFLLARRPPQFGDRQERIGYSLAVDVGGIGLHEPSLASSNQPHGSEGLTFGQYQGPFTPQQAVSSWASMSW